MIDEILPPTVCAVEAFQDLDGPLFPEEEASVARAVDKRRREFATVRHCARAAMARLGEPVAPIVPGAGGAPAWPDGLVGSMTHCDSYRAAAVARARDVAMIGIDAEPHLPLPSGVLDMISTGNEREHLSGLAADRPSVRWDRLLFCAKEAVYKAWFPLTRRWLGFEDAEISFDPLATSFTAYLLVEGPVIGGRLFGRFLVRDQLLVTTVARSTRTPEPRRPAAVAAPPEERPLQRNGLWSAGGAP